MGKVILNNKIEKGLLKGTWLKCNCKNPGCKQIFYKERWKKNSYCSQRCAFKDPALLQQMSNSGFKYKAKIKNRNPEEYKQERLNIYTERKHFKSLPKEEKLKIIGEKIAKTKRGIPRSIETKEKLRKARLGKTFIELFGSERAQEIINKQRYKVIGRKRGIEELEKWKVSRKKNGWFKNPKETGRKISLKNKGKGPYFYQSSQKVKEMIEKTKEAKRLNPDLIKGGFSKHYDSPIGKVFGKFELAYINKLISEKQPLPAKPQGVKTPLGNYHPDFEFEDRYVEIKSIFTYKVFVGEMHHRKSNTYSNKQQRKVYWTGINVKPVQVLVLDKNGNTLKEEWYTKETIKTEIVN